MDNAELNDIFLEIGLARARQDEQFGGPSHDDRHLHVDWLVIIVKQANQSISTNEFHHGKIDPDNFEQQMIETAAAAIAAIAFSRRRRVAGLDRQHLHPTLSEHGFQAILLRTVKQRYAVDVESRIIEDIYGEVDSPELASWCDENHITTTSLMKFGFPHIEFSQDDSEFWRNSEATNGHRHCELL